MAAKGAVTDLLVAWRDGNRAAETELLEAVYLELKRLAKSYLRREHSSCSLAPTALVHEAYLKLVDQRHVPWRNRSHFFGIAAQAMRRLLVDRARAMLAAKRGGAERRVPLEEVDAAVGGPSDLEVLALDKALMRLERVEPRWSRIVELRFFAGLSVDETATALDISPATVKRDWSLARAWLYREIEADAPTPRPDIDPS